MELLVPQSCRNIAIDGLHVERESWKRSLLGTEEVTEVAQ